MQLCPEQKEISSIKWGWLAPDGISYGGKEYNGGLCHIKLAEKIALNYRALEKQGYIKFCPNLIISGEPTKVTNLQQMKIIEYMQSLEKSSIRFGNNKYYSLYEISSMDLLAFRKVLNYVYEL